MATLRRLDISRDADKFLDGLAGKQYKQIVVKILDLTKDPEPHDSQKLQGYETKRRIDSGEFRVVYSYDEETVFIELVGKRNDDEVYRDLKRKG
ncbi:MAG TPA: type II toxin-antitoxin system RelE/ParE family toxin [Chthonomonadaceae bacterium]|nr:type II toxin-antitoxin system RelE/ParE family toxin [Chthonomonadaceae bacterium]